MIPQAAIDAAERRVTHQHHIWDLTTDPEHGTAARRELIHAILEAAAPHITGHLLEIGRP